MQARAGWRAAAEAGGPDRWAGFTAAFLGWAAALFGLAVGALVLIDPYDTGRPGLLTLRGSLNRDAFAANMTRLRDLRFDSAVIGNSHVQLLRPEQLDRLTGSSFVSLVLLGTFPADHLDILRVFVARHPAPPRTIVLGIDQFWCSEAVMRSEHFPDWVYADRFTDYLIGLTRLHSVKVARYRLLNLFRNAAGNLRPDGFFDYAPIYRELGLADPTASRARLAQAKAFPVNGTGRFPAVEELRRAIAAVPAATAILLVRTPVYRTALPDPATPEGRTAEACRAAVAEVAASRPKTAFVDVLGSGRFADEPANFYDHDHYRAPVAAGIEAELALALAGLTGRALPDTGQPARN